MSQKKHGALLVVMALLALPCTVGLFMVALIGGGEQQDPCDTTGGGFSAAYAVDLSGVPAGPIAGYAGEQLRIAATIMLVARDRGMSQRDQQLGVMAGMGESSLTNVAHGDAARNDTIGVFQIGPEHGTYEQRMDPAWAAGNFYDRLTAVAGYQDMPATLAINKAQRNADPWHYERYETPALEVVQALASVRSSGVAPAAATGQPAAAGAMTADQAITRYSLGAVEPQLAALVADLAPRFSIDTVGGYRASATDPNGHPAGLAADFMVPMDAAGKATGDALAAYAQAHADELAIDYLIWRQRIWSASRASEGWRPMEDRGSATANHFDHVHINVLSNGTVSAAATAAACLSNVAFGAEFVPPIDGAPVTSSYGPRSAPVEGASTFHEGTDYGAACGTPFRTIGAGTVIAAGPSAGYGHWIRVDHGGGIVSEYGHMYADGILVRVGDSVALGQEIGEVGADGYSSGCHLHLTIDVNGKSVDPEKFLADAAKTAGAGSIGVATFNALGDSHTAPGGKAAGMASGAERTAGLARLLSAHGTTLAGLQEFQPPQQDAFARIAGAQWASYGIRDNVIIWRRDTWSLLDRATLTIPYFDGSPREMPIVTLRHNATSKTIAVLNIHNAADVRHSPHNADSRAEALRRERAWVANNAGIPVLLVGDFNDREKAFCGLTAGGLMTAAAGGSNTSSCQMPPYNGIDWIFGRALPWGGHTVDRSPKGTISDHPYIAANTRL